MTSPVGEIALQLTRSPLERMILAFVDYHLARIQWLRTLDDIERLPVADPMGPWS